MAFAKRNAYLCRANIRWTHRFVHFPRAVGLAIGECNTVLWCNGSTRVFGSLSGGSNPPRTTTISNVYTGILLSGRIPFFVVAALFCVIPTQAFLVFQKSRCGLGPLQKETATFVPNNKQNRRIIIVTIMKYAKILMIPALSAVLFGSCFIVSGSLVQRRVRQSMW